MAEHDDNPQQPMPPEAESVTGPDLRSLLIGPPFAVCGDAEFLETNKETGVGSHACIKCDCGHAFKLDLLSARPKVCPSCKSTYTHTLIVCRTDDADMFDDVVRQVLIANGIEPPDDEEEDDTDEDDAGDDDE